MKAPKGYKLDILNEYDRFDLPFLKEEGGRLFNDTFDVTDAKPKLTGVPTGKEEIKLVDYLVYRPIPAELIKWRNVPKLHPDSLDMEFWYKELVNYCKNGVWVDGEYWNPYMVYWMNVYVFPIYKTDEDGNPTEDFIPGHPYYCNIDRYILDVAWKAELTRKDVSLMGGRGIGKSYLWNSILDREFRLFPKSWSIISSTGEDETNEAWRKIEETLDVIEKKHPALKHKRQGANSGEKKMASEKYVLPDGTEQYRGYQSIMEKIIYGRKAGKTRGRRPTKQLIEEFAAFPPSKSVGNLRSCMRESRGSWYVGGGLKKCTVLYSGTGGTVENDEAEEIFCNPTAHTIIATYDWEEAGARGCGIFIPTHIKRTGTWEKTGCPDISQGRAEVEVEREAARHDPISYMGLLQEFPMTIKEVFMRSGVNIFNQDKIASQRNEIKFNENIPKPGKGFLKFKEGVNGRIIGVEWHENPFGNIEILEHPYWKTDQAKTPDEQMPIPKLYVAGIDSIDQGNSDSSTAVNSIKGSELAMLVKKRILEKNYFKTTSNLYVAKYVKRSDDVRDDWGNALKLAIYYEARVNLEYTRISIVSYFRDKGFYNMLMKRPSIAISGADPSKTSNLIGTTTATAVIEHQDLKCKEYVDDYYDQIYFDDLLEQLQNYDRDDRTKFDLVIAMGLCELADEDLMGQQAKPEKKVSDEFQDFGYYTDENGYKRRGIIPNKTKQVEELLDSAKFAQHGGVRWIDYTDPEHPVVKY